MCEIEKQALVGGGSIVTDVIEGWTATVTGPLVTPPAVTVMVAVPAIGLPEESFPLQTTKIESQTPPHTWPAGDMVAMLVLEELKVKVVTTEVSAEFTAAGVRVTTCPATSESVVGVTVTDATTFALEEELPPHPATKNKERMDRTASIPAKYRLTGLFPCVFGNI